MARIAHLTTVHSRDDIRIFRKECATLSRQGHEVFLVVADGNGDDEVDGVALIDIGKPSNRAQRALKSRQAIKTVRSLKPTFVHFHDPELIPAGLLLKLMGYKVIYDVPEDVPATVRTKSWLPFGSRNIVALLADAADRIGGAVFDKIVTATPHIASRFPAKKTVTVQNYPLESELWQPAPKRHSTPIFAYVGGVTLARGYPQMVAALQYLCTSGVDAELHIAGRFTPVSLAEQFEDAFDNRIFRHGHLSRRDVGTLLSRSLAGLVLFQPHPNHISAQPNKMFEYMSAGLPVIASNFPLWREIIEGNECGICVDPRNPVQIADAMKWLIDNPSEAREMGRRGRSAIELRFNWRNEEAALISAYA